MRRATEADRPALAELWRQAFGDEEEFIDFVYARFAGLEHTYLEEREGAPIASLCALPVTLGRLRGIYLYGVNTRADLRGQGVMTRLMEEVHAHAARNGADFAVLVPASARLFDYYAHLGYETRFFHRAVRLEEAPEPCAQVRIERVAGEALAQLRIRFLPAACISFEAGAREALAESLSAEGARIVVSPDGYGVYLKDDKGLCFRELAAKDEGAARRLIRSVCAQPCSVRLLLPEASELFAAEGMRRAYGMIKWLRGEKRLCRPHMALMGD